MTVWFIHWSSSIVPLMLCWSMTVVYTFPVHHVSSTTTDTISFLFTYSSSSRIKPRKRQTIGISSSSPSVCTTMKLFSRDEFVSSLLFISTTPLVVNEINDDNDKYNHERQEQEQQRQFQAPKVNSDLYLPLKFLPVGGCWAIKLSITDEESFDDFTYYAIIDTGSPFLTAPPVAAPYTNSIVPITPGKRKRRGWRRDDDADDDNNGSSFAATTGTTSMEQYGQTLGEIEWRQAKYMTVIGSSSPSSPSPSSSSSSLTTSTTTTSTRSSNGNNNKSTIKVADDKIISIVESENVILGISSSTVIEETGGIFVGLIAKDDYHPTWIQQLAPPPPTQEQQQPSSLIEDNTNIATTTTTRTTTTNSDMSMSPTPIEGMNNKKRFYNYYKSFAIFFGSSDDASASSTPSTKKKHPSPFLQLSPDTLIEKDDPTSFPLISLQPYGPDLYHYAIPCSQLELTWKNTPTAEAPGKIPSSSSFAAAISTLQKQQQRRQRQVIPTSGLERPVVAVIDTGLTGCIMSDTLYDELIDLKRTYKEDDVDDEHEHDDDDDISSSLLGIKITLSNCFSHPSLSMHRTITQTPAAAAAADTDVASTTMTADKSFTTQQQQQQQQHNKDDDHDANMLYTLDLTSNDKYWIFSSFHLPWFYEDTDDDRINDDDDGRRNDNRRHRPSVSSSSSSSFLLPPHVIALGSTFWADNDNVESIVIDTIHQRAKINKNIK